MKLTEARYAELQAKAIEQRRGSAHAKRSAALYEQARPKRSKYGNKKTISNGMVFDSGLEARRYAQLELMQRDGQIRNLQRQVHFDIVVNGQHICTYIADAVYETCQDPWGANDWERHVEDTKSVITRKKPDYRLKAKLMLAVHGIEIREVMA